MNMNGIPIALGTASFGTTVSRDDSFGVLDKYASLGGRTIDTANNYAYWDPQGKGGESEAVIGDWLERGDRSLFTVMTKIGSQPLGGTKDINCLEGLSPDAVHCAVDRSLDRLKTDYIDILLAHHDDRNTPLLDTWKAFSELVSCGKVRKVGVSNYSPRRVAEMVSIATTYELAPLEVLQLQYSLLEPIEDTELGMLVRLDADMKDAAARLVPQVDIFAYSPLLGGRVFEKGANEIWPVEYDSMKNRQTVERIQLLAREMDVSPSALVLKRIADEGFWPVTATRSAERLEANLILFVENGSA